MFALVCIVGFFVMVGVFGATFAATCISSGEAQLRGDTNQEKIYNFWIQNEFSPAQAAGITASIQHESGYSPFRQEMSASWPGGGYGIAQFTGGQRQAVTEYMSSKLGDEFTLYYKNQYGGAVSASNGFMPEGMDENVNDKFLSSQLQYLLEYTSSFKPSSIRLRTSGFEAMTGVSVPRDATLAEFLRTIPSSEDTAIAWTFLYEFPGNINATARARANTATEVQAALASLENDGTLDGSCGGGDIVAPVAAENLIVTSGSEVRSRVNNSGVYVTRAHEGIDIIGGSDIVAMMEGTVIVARNGYGGYGTAVKIDHGNGTFTLYGHMVYGSLDVQEGQHVNAGQRLGTMGTTGDSDGVHLHFQLWIEDTLYNPYPFLVDHGVKLEWQDGAYPRNEKPGPIPHN